MNGIMRVEIRFLKSIKGSGGNRHVWMREKQERKISIREKKIKETKEKVKKINGRKHLGNDNETQEIVQHFGKCGYAFSRVS